MAAIHKAIKSKAKKSTSVKVKTARTGLAKVKRAEAPPEPLSKPTLEDKKTIRGVESLTGYLGLAATVNALILIYQLWATFNAGYVLSVFSILYLFLSIASIGALVWCVILLNRKSALALWAFTGFVAASLINKLAVRWYGGNALFAPLDLIGYILQAAILSSIYWLKRKEYLA